MNQVYLAEFIQYFCLIPAAAICFLPVKNQLKYSAKTTAGIAAGGITSLSLAGIFSNLSLGVNGDLVFFAAIIMCFVFYYRMVKCGLGEKLAIFFLSIALSSFMSDYAIAVDAWIHPTENRSDFCVTATGVQLIFSVSLTLLLAHLLLKYGCRLVDQLFNARVWYVMIPAPLIFSAVNYLIQPRDYSHLYFSNLFFLYLFVLSGMFLLMLIIYVSFYFVAMELIQSLDQRERIQLMQMQEHQYIAQQTYIEESSRIRHDFRQSAITMLRLAEQNDVEALKNYLQSFVADLPQNEIRAWCRNSSVNALLNYYETLLEMYGVRRQWEISLSDCKISDNDLCGMLGNLLENVYHGCLTAKEGERFHHFSVLLKNERDLYIVSSNSFDDEVRKKDGKYASSRKDGSGIGLSSIRITAEKYNGTARFSHDDKVFYIDVVMEV